MSGTNYFNEYSDDFDSNGGQGQAGGLRKMLEEALAEIKELRGELREVQRGDTVEDLLESKGLDPRVAQIIPKDADPAAWLNDYADLFGTKMDESGELPPPDVEIAPESEELRAEREALEALQGVQSTGTSTTTPDPFEKLRSFKSEAEMLAFLQQQGGQD